MQAAKPNKYYIPRDNNFYRKYYFYFFIALIVAIFLLMIALGVVIWQVTHRPLPLFMAITPNKKEMQLTPFDEPNLLPDTILRWASKAATTAYTFDFANYNSQVLLAKPYFTDAGWQTYLNSLTPLIENITQNKIFVYSVVSGTPVISNQGNVPDRGYVWRVQIPFLVSYVTAGGPTNRNFIVILSVVRISTSKNPQGIGIDQFIMVPL